MFSWSLIWACVWQYNQQIKKYHGTVEHMLLHYRWSLSEYGIIRFDMWKASIYVLKNIFYIFAFIIIYINPYMFRYYTGMLCFLIKYLRILINFSLLTTILATLNEEIEFLKQFSLKQFHQNYLMLNSVPIYFWLKATHAQINPTRFNLWVSRFYCTCSVGLHNLV